MTHVYVSQFFRNFVRAGIILFNLATDSAMGFFIYYHASHRALNSLSNEYCQDDAKS